MSPEVIEAIEWYRAHGVDAVRRRTGRAESVLMGLSDAQRAEFEAEIAKDATLVAALRRAQDEYFKSMGYPDSRPGKSTVFSAPPDPPIGGGH